MSAPSPKRRARVIDGFVLAACLVGLGSSTGCIRPSVDRAMGGEVVRGRFIVPGAYAAYARGAIAEADGRLEQARADYAAAASLDDDGAEPRARLGAVLCLLRRWDEATRAFDEALERDARHALVWSERARCEFSRGHQVEAARSVERAMGLDPEAVGLSILRSEILVAMGKPEDARAELLGRLAREARSVELVDALSTLANDVDSPGLRGFSRDLTASFERSPEGLGDDRRRARSPWPGAEPTPRRPGHDARASALRAWLEGDALAAREQARARRAADPDDAEARLVELAATALLDSDLPALAQLARAYSDALREEPSAPARANAIAFDLLDEVLLRWVGPAAFNDAESEGALRNQIRKRMEPHRAHGAVDAR